MKRVQEEEKSHSNLTEDKEDYDFDDKGSDENSDDDDEDEDDEGGVIKTEDLIVSYFHNI